MRSILAGIAIALLGASSAHDQSSTALTWSAAMSFCGVSECHLTVPMALTQNDGCNGDVVLTFAPGVTVTQTGSFSLKMSCSIVAHTAQIFSGFSPGQVTFGNSPPTTSAIHPEWWGASPSAAAAVNTVAINAAVGACMGGPPIEFPQQSVYMVAGVGTPGANGANDAAITINPLQSWTPIGQPCLIKGNGATLRLAPNNNFNVLSIADYSGAIDSYPITIENLTLDGNWLSQAQQPAGDTYQNGFAATNVSGLVLKNVHCTGGAYYGCSFNAVQDSQIDVFAYDNASSNVLITGQGDCPNCGVRDIFTVRTINSGQAGGSNPNFLGDCSDIGIYVGSLFYSKLLVVSGGNNQPSSSVCVNSPSQGSGVSDPGGLNISNSAHNSIELVSQNDRTAFIYDTNVNYNTITVTATGWVVACHGARNSGVDPGNNVIVAMNCN
jgi:hypothetical protein